MEGGASISKVSVEYHDPFGVFQYVARQLDAHLPLRNLNWKSPTRPLRSIDSLHVDLVAAQDFDRPGSRHGTPGLEHSNSPARTPSERRHQIPGLRQTPYLKIFLLRCDDSETYKSTARKNLREWLKAHTPASQSSTSRSAQENHEAYEWLIIHVVLPNTAAASQPRMSSSSSKTENVASEKSGSSSKLLGRSSSTILEKLKADFNISSKSAPDRVEQVRLRIEDLTLDALPPKPLAGLGDFLESPQDQAKAWQDLMNKLKTLILCSFSLRVSQYEEDIRERDAQRALPGWNFCTFFMLKEGLLRGFESVGLVDDALIGYDELSLGLENAVNDGNEDGMTTRSDSFLKYTKEMKDLLLQCLTSDTPADIAWENATQFISTSRKDYRNLIVNSNVSRFDFQSYIFARQIAILMRMSSPISTGSFQQLSNQGKVTAATNLVALSELCQRTIAFISETSRTLKAELLQAATAQGIDAPVQIVENIVASFGLSVAEQVLSVTNVPALDQAWEESTAMRQNHDLHRLEHPERKSSLPPRTPIMQISDDPVVMMKYFDMKASMQQRAEDDLSMPAATDLEILAGNRGELLFLQRHASEKIAMQKLWKLGASSLYTQFDNVDLDHDANETHEKSSASSLRGILYTSLLSSMVSMAAYQAWYEKLSISILKQCVLATKPRSAERLCADLAVLRYEDGDYTTALALFTRVVPTFATRNWDLIETQLVRLFLQCLKKLNRMDDYLRMGLTALSKAALRKKARQMATNAPSFIATEPQMSEDLLSDILQASVELPSEIFVSLNDFFMDLSVTPYIQQLEHQDGFSLQIKICSLLDADISVQRIRMKLRSTEAQFREVWLEAISPTTLRPGFNTITLVANTTCFGNFAVDKLSIVSSKINLEAEIKRQIPPTLSGDVSFTSSDGEAMLVRLPNILCYPTNGSLAIDVAASRDIHINKIKTLEIEVKAARNTVEKGQLNLRAASAGLRLMIAEAKASRSDVALNKGKDAGSLELSGLEPHSAIKIVLPYDLESNLSQISIALDFQYTTAAGSFSFHSNPSVVVDLAVDVNVHDLFKDGVLFSRFQIRASRGVPLLVTDVQLAESDRFAVEATPCKLTPMLVLPQQDGGVLYKVTPKSIGQLPRQTMKNEKPLTLTIKYEPLDEIILTVMLHSLLSGLESTNFIHLEPLMHAVLMKFCRSLSYDQFEEAILLNEFHLPNFESMGWSDALEGLEPHLRREIRLWLHHWHVQNHVLVIKMCPDSLDSKDLHSITIDVPLPRLQILHTASLTLPPGGFISQGSVVPAKIMVQHTRKWESPSFTLQAADQQLELALEVDAPPDAWLLGGDRRVSFAATDRQVQIFELLLIPLKTGRLLLPEVNVRWAGPGEEEVRCETDFRSAGETVVVVADVKSTTVGLNEMGSGTEIMLMTSEPR